MTLDPELAAELAEQYGTPLYAYDVGALQARVGELVESLPPSFRLLYSLKANPLPSLAEVLRRAGCGAEVSSLGEVEAALAAGFPAASVLYGGPGKTPQDLRQALGLGIGVFSCESWRELELLQDLCAEAASGVEVLLRINPGEPGRAGLTMAGEARHFGFDPAALIGEAARLRHLRRVEVVGVHFYQGTQVPVDVLGATFDEGCRVARELAPVLGLRWRVVDLGGGFPWPMASVGRGPDAGALRQALAATVRRPPAPATWLESGRFLTASAGTLVLRVLDVRPRAGRRVVVADGGINHLGGMSGLGRLLRPHVDVVAVRGGAPTGAADVVGPLCTPLDVLARSISLPHCEPGDLLSIPNVGAYGATASLVAFLSRRPAVEVVHRGHRVLAAGSLRHGHRGVPLARPHHSEPASHVH